MLIQTSEIIKRYKCGESVLSLSHAFNTYTQKIQYILDKNAIKKVTQAKRNNPDLIENYFENIDSKEKAYWIGWILADGGVTTDGHIEIALNEQDKYILELFQQDLCIVNHVKPYGKGYYRFQLGSKCMTEDLKKYGIVPNKTLTLKFPNNVPKKFETHLLRGMFEGDGGLTIGKTTRFYKHRGKSYIKPYRELSFTGTYGMCKGFHDKLKQYTEFTDKNINKNHSIFRVRWSNKKEIINILDTLYQDCGGHFLNRKYQIYQEIKKTE